MIPSIAIRCKLKEIFFTKKILKTQIYTKKIRTYQICD